MNDDIKFSSLSNSFWKKLHKRDRLSDYLPYYIYDDENKIYINNNNTYGVIFEIVPRNIAGENSAINFGQILEKMPHYMIMQVMLFGSKNDDGAIDYWREFHSRRTRGFDTNNPSKELINKTIENIETFYRLKLKESISKRMVAHLKDFRLYISLVSNKKDELMSYSTSLFNSLESNNFYPLIIKPNRLKSILYEILNSNHNIEQKAIPKYDEYMELNRQLICTDTEIRFNDYSAVVDDRYWINLSPNKLPDNADISDFGQKIGDTITSILDSNQFKDTFIITANLTKIDKRKKNKIRTAHQVITTQNWNSTIFRKFNAVREESVGILERMDVKGENLFSLDMNVLVSANSYEKALNEAHHIENYWQSMQNSPIELRITNGIHQLCFMASLPMNIYDEYFKITSKSKSLFTEQVTQFIPLEADWKGVNPNIFLVSRRGQLAGLDFFASDTNYNGFVIAESGAGKSVFLNNLAFSSYARGDRVFIFDYGGSYKNLCEVLGGTYIEPNTDNPVSINPFSKITSKEHLQEELQFLSMFVYGLGANNNKEEYEKNEKFMKSLLQDVIAQCYNELKEKLEITDINDNLFAMKQEDARVVDFCQQLRMYCRGGIYEKFFTGPCALDFSNHFIVCEIQQVENDPDLRDPIIMLMTYHQENAIYGQKNIDYEIKFLNIYDEAHKFLGKSLRIDDFIEQNYRRGRKHAATTLIATQGFNDVYDEKLGMLSKAGKAIINSSAWKIFLSQTATSTNLLISSKLFDFSEFDEMQLKSVTTLKGEYSELFMITPNDSKFVYRLILDRFSYYLTTTNKDDRHKIQLKINQGMTTVEAIESIVKEEGLSL